ncbi:hypothetical protein [Dyella caseinilytica]|uniref:Uncharacterized protein n=1 Tax=Dyella caseinilytica TaxID=1849581 RepID=A0ABX7GVY6_9GAMM|nr:hypothetical protein [Dyella caseinilytica]QRN54123.1 hypothetical protein ISN74_01595 [Dyella caseinilytica]GFZ91701.1 hypothetical protein GCM10011408_08900 [Dyella caseinilytica]
MQTLKLSVSLPDATHPQMELRVSSNDSDCDVVIELPVRGQTQGGVTKTPNTPMTAEEEYELGGYAGI